MPIARWQSDDDKELRELAARHKKLYELQGQYVKFIDTETGKNETL